MLTRELLGKKKFEQSLKRRPGWEVWRVRAGLRNSEALILHNLPQAAGLQIKLKVWFGKGLTPFLSFANLNHSHMKIYYIFRGVSG